MCLYVFTTRPKGHPSPARSPRTWGHQLGCTCPRAGGGTRSLPRPLWLKRWSPLPFHFPSHSLIQGSCFRGKAPESTTEKKPWSPWNLLLHPYRSPSAPQINFNSHALCPLGHLRRTIPGCLTCNQRRALRQLELPSWQRSQFDDPHSPWPLK